MAITLPRLVGVPESLVRLAAEVDDAANELEQLRKLLDADVDKIIPDRWDTKTSNWFNDWWYWLRDDVLKYGQIVRKRWEEALREAAQRLQDAKSVFERANEYARAHNLLIRDDLVVVPLDRNNPQAQADAVIAEYMVRSAWQMAEDARQRLADANEEMKELLDYLDQLLLEQIRDAFRRDHGPRPRVPRRLGITPKKPEPKKAKSGREFHQMMSRTERPLEGTLLSQGWSVLGIERSFGGSGKADAVYINHTSKKILIVDYYTGPVESQAHADKTQSYRNLPEIVDWRKKGYKVDAMTVMVPKKPN